LDQAASSLEQGRLAGPIGPQQAGDTGPGNIEAELVQRCDATGVTNSEVLGHEQAPERLGALWVIGGLWGHRVSVSAPPVARRSNYVTMVL
jgi:hypothetical protein